MAMHLLCHLERLPDYGTGDVYFSLNLTIGFDADPGKIDAGLARLLSPWRWTLGTIDYYLITGGVLGAKLQATRVGSVSVDPGAPFSKKLGTVLDRFIASRPSSSFVWKPGKDQTLKRPGDELCWHDYLIHASTYPAALAQAAGISCVFKVSGAGGADRLIAAPRIDFGDGTGEHTPVTAGGFGAGVDTVQVGSTPKDQPPFFYEWKYDAAIVAYQRECLLDRPKPNASDDQFLDLTTGWVTAPGDDTVAEDWALQLEARLTEAFDLPMRFLATFRAKNFTLTKNKRRVVLDLVTAALHDIAGTGRNRSTATLAPTLLAHLRAELRKLAWTDQDLAALDKALADYERSLTLEDWRKALVETTGTKVFIGTGDQVEIPHDRALDELARIHGLLADEAILRRLMVKQWELAAEQSKNDDLLRKIRAAEERLVQAILPAFKLKKISLLDALQEVWSDIAGLRKAAKRKEQVEALKIVVAAALKRYLHARFDDASSAYAGFLPRDVKLPPAIERRVAKHIDAYVAALVDPPKKRGVTPLVPESRKDHDALVIQLADVSQVGDDVTTEADQTGSSRRIAGYGVLLRRGVDDPWRCLNYAQVVDGDDGAPLSEEPLVVPLRLGYRNGVRQTFVAYENTPLVAESPFKRLLEEHSLDDELHLDDDVDPVVRYLNPYGGQGKPTLVPLIYGWNYQAAAFVIGVAGSFPRGLATATDGNVDPTVPNVAGATPSHVRTLAFRRRVPVGLPRPANLGKSAELFETLALPLVPPTVRPLARSLNMGTGGSEAGIRTSRPLVFLRTLEGALGKFDFALSPPSVDIHTWDRWMAADQSEEMKKKRIAVWAAYHEHAARAGTIPNLGAAKLDLALDDPAVAAWVLRLTPVFRRGAIPQPETVVVPLSAKDASNEPLDIARHKPLDVTLLAKTGGSVEIAPANPTTEVTIKIPDGEVWTLEIFPAVATTDVDDRFAADVAPVDTHLSWTLFEPFALDVETTPERIEIPASELYGALSLDLLRDADGDALVVSLDGDQMPTSSAWVYRVEMVLQQWRWSGRPMARSFDGTLVDGFPAGVVGPDDDAVLFADRAPNDALTIPGFVDFVANEPAKIDLHRRDLHGSPGALYFRAAVKAHSRYEGVVVDGITSNDSRNAEFPEAWFRYVVPCRWNAEVPPPVIKLVVPLTLPLADQDVPPLLAVLDEPWSDVGGLAEKLTVEVMDVARIMKADDGSYEEKPEDRVLELGPDPMLSVAPLDTSKVKLQQPIGPIGYTFDTDTDSPLFVKTSFILPAPRDAGDLSWHFVKLRFRRVLDGDWHITGTSRESAPTQPVWAQYLPPSNRFGTAQVEGLTLRIEKDEAGTRIGSFRDADGTITSPTATATANPKCIFELFVVLTERIDDATGRPDQERYVDVLRIRRTFEVPADIPTLANPRARIIEVQRRADAPIADPRKLWEVLLASAPNEDATARIVRVSPLIPSDS